MRERSDSLEEKIKKKAYDIGFSELKISILKDDPTLQNHLNTFLSLGYHAQMTWLSETFERRSSPQKLWPEAQTALVVMMNYHFGLSPLERLKNKETGVISVYALHRDYHDLLKGKLKTLASWFYHQTGQEVKVFVDTAPVMEKPLAVQAGLGWQGKHTNVVSKNFGSWTFLGVLLTTAVLEPDQEMENHCGSCRACLDICPTQAFPKPYHLDARRCLSYWTIEEKGHIPQEFRKPLGNRIYGCDDCLAVCPWNKFAKCSQEMKLKPREDLINPPLEDLVQLKDDSFRKKFSASPVKRLGRDRFIRNVLIAIGNSDLPNKKKILLPFLKEPSPLVRAMAIWGLKQSDDDEELEFLKKQYAKDEKDDIVQKEWFGE